MKIKQRRERESGREHSLFLSFTICRGEFLRQRHRHGQQHPRQMPASLDWFSLRKTIGDPGGVCWTSQCARPQRCLVYIIYIQSRSQCQLCECVCVCVSVCILSVSVSVCACPIGGSISWLHCRKAATLKVQKSYLSIHMYIQYIYLCMHDYKSYIQLPFVFEIIMKIEFFSRKIFGKSF